MLMAIVFFDSRPVKAALVNWLPWSVLKIAGLPYLTSAASSASRQNATSSVMETCQESTRRLNQSTTAAR
jgi:hypothetical protein